MYRGWASDVHLPDCTLGKALILRPPTSGTSRGLCPHSLGSTGGRHGDEDGPRAVRTAGRGLHRIAGVRGAGSGLLGLRRLHRERGARPSEVAAARGLPVRARASRGGARPPRKSPRGARPRSGVGAPAPRAAGGSAPGRRARTPAGGGRGPGGGRRSTDSHRAPALRRVARGRAGRAHRDRRLRVHALAGLRPHGPGAGDPPRAGGPGARVVHPPLGGGRAPRRAGAGRSRSVRRLLRVHRRRGADDRRADAARERVHAALLPRRDRGGDAAMRLVGATLYALRIPFVEAFSHSATERRWSDSVVVRVRDDAGTEGFGEGAPRPYVTGETVETMLEHLGRDLWPRVAGREVPPACNLEALAAFIPETGLAGAIAPHASRAALELAVLDCALQRAGRSLATLLPPRRSRVTYSGVIAAGPIARAVLHARRMRAIGMRHVKVKVGFDDDVARVTAVREALGPGVTLRLDANGAWTFERAVAVLAAVAPLGIAAVEQPLPRGPVDDLARLRQATPVPVMVDESLVTEAAADALT